jgi:hypothetical protein
MTSPSKYPLAWPFGWKRNPLGGRRTSPFKSGRNKVTVYDAITRLERQLDLLHATDPVLSSNLRTGLRGDPLSNQPEPQDRGVAVYFKMRSTVRSRDSGGEVRSQELVDRVLACDVYTTTSGNIAAIANHIDALRRIERYGVGTLDQAFAGYDALPAPSANNRAPWRSIFGIHPTANITPEDVNLVYRARAKNVATNESALLTLNLAREDAMRELGASK